MLLYGANGRNCSRFAAIFGTRPVATGYFLCNTRFGTSHALFLLPASQHDIAACNQNLEIARIVPAQDPYLIRADQTLDGSSAALLTGSARR